MFGGGRGRDCGGQGQGGHQYCVPAAWGPECEHHSPPYHFRAWTKDVRLWSMLTDRDPRQQAASIVLRPSGQAKETARTLTHAELMNGGVILGRRLDPVTYILVGLAMRYTQLGDESCLAALVEFQAFQRNRGQSINQLLDSFDIVRRRAEEKGNFVQSVEASAPQLLRCCHLRTQQFLTYLAPFGGRLPTVEHARFP